MNTVALAILLLGGLIAWVVLRGLDRICGALQQIDGSVRGLYYDLHLMAGSLTAVEHEITGRDGSGIMENSLNRTVGQAADAIIQIRLHLEAQHPR